MWDNMFNSLGFRIVQILSDKRTINFIQREEMKGNTGSLGMLQLGLVTDKETWERTKEMG